MSIEKYDGKGEFDASVDIKDDVLTLKASYNKDGKPMGTAELIVDACAFINRTSDQIPVTFTGDKTKHLYLREVPWIVNQNIVEFNFSGRQDPKIVFDNGQVEVREKAKEITGAGTYHFPAMEADDWLTFIAFIRRIEDAVRVKPR